MLHGETMAASKPWSCSHRQMSTGSTEKAYSNNSDDMKRSRERADNASSLDQQQPVKQSGKAYLPLSVVSNTSKTAVQGGSRQAGMMAASTTPHANGLPASMQKPLPKPTFVRPRRPPVKSVTGNGTGALTSKISSQRGKANTRKAVIVSHQDVIQMEENIESSPVVAPAGTMKTGAAQRCAQFQTTVDYTDECVQPFAACMQSSEQEFSADKVSEMPISTKLHASQGVACYDSPVCMRNNTMHVSNTQNTIPISLMPTQTIREHEPVHISDHASDGFSSPNPQQYNAYSLGNCMLDLTLSSKCHVSEPDGVSMLTPSLANMSQHLQGDDQQQQPMEYSPFLTNTTLGTLGTIPPSSPFIGADREAEANTVHMLCSPAICQTCSGDLESGSPSPSNVTTSKQHRRIRSPVLKNKYYRGVHTGTTQHSMDGVYENTTSQPFHSRKPSPPQTDRTLSTTPQSDMDEPDVTEPTQQLPVSHSHISQFNASGGSRRPASRMSPSPRTQIVTVAPPATTAQQRSPSPSVHPPAAVPHPMAYTTLSQDAQAASNKIDSIRDQQQQQKLRPIRRRQTVIQTVVPAVVVKDTQVVPTSPDKPAQQVARPAAARGRPARNQSPAETVAHGDQQRKQPVATKPQQQRAVHLQAANDNGANIQNNIGGSHEQRAHQQQQVAANTTAQHVPPQAIQPVVASPFALEILAQTKARRQQQQEQRQVQQQQQQQAQRQQQTSQWHPPPTQISHRHHHGHNVRHPLGSADQQPPCSTYYGPGNEPQRTQPSTGQVWAEVPTQVWDAPYGGSGDSDHGQASHHQHHPGGHGAKQQHQYNQHNQQTALKSSQNQQSVHNHGPMPQQIIQLHQHQQRTHANDGQAVWSEQPDMQWQGPHYNQHLELMYGPVQQQVVQGGYTEHIHAMPVDAIHHNSMHNHAHASEGQLCYQQPQVDQQVWMPDGQFQGSPAIQLPDDNGHATAQPELDMSYWRTPVNLYEVLPFQQNALEFASWCNRVPQPAVRDLIKLKYGIHDYKYRWDVMKQFMDDVIAPEEYLAPINTLLWPSATPPPQQPAIHAQQTFIDTQQGHGVAGNHGLSGHRQPSSSLSSGANQPTILHAAQQGHLPGSIHRHGMQQPQLQQQVQQPQRAMQHQVHHQQEPQGQQPVQRQPLLQHLQQQQQQHVAAAPRWWPGIREGYRVFCEEYASSKREGYTRRFMVTSYEELWKRMVAKDASTRHFYEIISADRPCHLYFDIEFSRAANPGVDGMELVDKVITLVKRLYREDWGIELDDSCFLELESRIGLTPSHTSGGGGKSSGNSNGTKGVTPMMHSVGAHTHNDSKAAHAVQSSSKPPGYQANRVTNRQNRVSQQVHQPPVTMSDAQLVLSQTLVQKLTQEATQGSSMSPSQVSQTQRQSQAYTNLSQRSNDVWLGIWQDAEATEGIQGLLNPLIASAARELQQPDKFSVHLIVRAPGGWVLPNNLAVGAAVGSLRRWEAQWSELQVNKSLKPEDGMTSAVDLAVYSKTRNFRCVWCCKGGKEAVLRPTTRYMGALRNPLAAAGTHAPSPRTTTPNSIATSLSNEEVFLASLICNVPEGARMLSCDHLQPLSRTSTSAGNSGNKAGGNNASSSASSRRQGSPGEPTSDSIVPHPSDDRPIRLTWTLLQEDALVSGYREALRHAAVQAVTWAEALTAQRAGGKPTVVRSISYIGEGSKVAYTLLGAGSHWCERIGRAHRSNHVYLVLDWETYKWTQKCFDLDCAGWHSAWTDMPPDIAQAQVLDPLRPPLKATTAMLQQS